MSNLGQGIDAVYDKPFEAFDRPGYVGGHVMCRVCGSVRKQDPADGLRHGWPMCCGQTMTIDVLAEVEMQDE